MIVRTALIPPSSPARESPGDGRRVRVGVVQQRWWPDPEDQREALAEGVRLAAERDATLVCLQELTLSPYFATTADQQSSARDHAEPVADGPTHRLAADLARRYGVHVQASLFESRGTNERLGFNTAIVVDPSGRVAMRTRKLHIPVTAGYFEDQYFEPGPAGEQAVATLEVGGAAVGVPTCWDQWFPELARSYALGGADVLVYPTAIGSEPDHPEFDTEPIWRAAMIGHAIANGLFVVAVNRVGAEGPLTFYGSSFIADPYGRVLVQAPRDEPAVLVAELDLDQRRDWLDLFPFFRTRRPDVYGKALATAAPTSKHVGVAR